MRLNIDKDSFLASLELGIKSELKHKGVSKDTPLIEYDTESEDVEDLEVAETEEFINEENELDFNMDLDDEDEEEAFDMGLDDEDDAEEFEEEDLGESEEESITEVEEIIQDIDFDTGYFGLDDDDEAEEEDFEEEIDLGEETESDFDMSLDDEDDEEFDTGLDDEDDEESLEESEVAEGVFEEIEEEVEGGDFLAGLDDDEDEEEVDYIDMDSDDEEDYEDADYLDMNSDDGEDEELIPIQTNVEVDTTRKPKNSIYVENSSSENKSKIGVTAPKNPIITDNDTLISNISDSKNIVYSAGMTIIEFLRKNPKARTETDVLKYFTKDALAQELKKGKVLVKRGKLFI